MSDVAAMNEVLEDGLEDGTQVQVTVAACEYRCCGGGWQERNLSRMTYTGRVLSIDVDSFLLQLANELGKVAEVIARFDDLVDARLIVD